MDSRTDKAVILGHFRGFALMFSSFVAAQIVPGLFHLGAVLPALCGAVIVFYFSRHKILIFAHLRIFCNS